MSLPKPVKKTLLLCLILAVYLKEVASLNATSNEDDDYYSLKSDENTVKYSLDKGIPVFKDEGWFVEGILLKLLVFICCAAGVFGLLSMCCVVCGWFCSSSGGGSVRIDRNRDSSLENDILVWECRRENQIYLQRGGNDTIIAFIPRQNPGDYFQQSSPRYDEMNDLPPSYDDLSPKAEINSSSPPPPPYTPSFKLPEVKANNKQGG